SPHARPARVTGPSQGDQSPPSSRQLRAPPAEAAKDSAALAVVNERAPVGSASGVSRVSCTVAGEGSTLPAASMARTASVVAPRGPGAVEGARERHGGRGGAQRERGVGSGGDLGGRGGDARLGRRGAPVGRGGVVGAPAVVGSLAGAAPAVDRRHAQHVVAL